MDLSIIVPVYNVENYLFQCLESAIAQTGFAHEIICINDGSTDTSLEILREYEQRYPDLIRVFSQENRGLGATRNWGVSLARGKYLLFLDSDDWLTEGSLEPIMAEVLADSPDILVAGANVVRDQEIIKVHGEVDKIVKKGMKGTVYLTFTGNFSAVAWGKIYKTTFLKKEGIKNFENAYYEDVCFSIPAYLKAEKIKNTEKIFYNYRRNAHSITGKSPTEKHLRDFVTARLEVYHSELKNMADTKVKNVIKKKYSRSVYDLFKVIKRSNVPPKMKLSYCATGCKHAFFLLF